MQHRREIDGLRALAIIPVILFHSGIAGFAGGYAGVDIFFVISGFLITTIIADDLDRGAFSLTRFYEARARRILPALFVVMAISTVFAVLWMLPDDLQNFGQSLVATSLFANNMLLAATSGYWSQAAELKPLLHSWTLGVEEQFYLLYPLCLILLWKWSPRARITALAVGALFSLLLSIALQFFLPQFVFYTLSARAWELLAGALIARAQSRWGPARPDGSNARLLSIAGLAVTGGAILLPLSTPFPTLLATIGTALLLRYAVPGTQVQRLLAHRVPVGIGLVSYGTYLWHYPLFAFARIYSPMRPPMPVMASLVIAAFALGVLSWRFVERPFRDRTRVSRRTVFVLAAAFSAIFMGIGLVFHFSNGLPRRMAAEDYAEGVAGTIDYNQRVWSLRKDGFNHPDRIKLLVIGDSFGRDFVNMVIENFDANRVEIIYRSELPQCIAAVTNPVAVSLFRQADVIVYAHKQIFSRCMAADLRLAAQRHQQLFYSGRKYFGDNLNWLIRVPANRLANLRNPLPNEVILTDRAKQQAVPPPHYISLIAPITIGNMIQITDSKGRLISADRQHLTRAGAQLLGARVLLPGAFGSILPHKRPVSTRQTPINSLEQRPDAS